MQLNLRGKIIGIAVLYGMIPLCIMTLMVISYRGKVAKQSQEMLQEMAKEVVSPITQDMYNLVKISCDIAHRRDVAAGNGNAYGALAPEEMQKIKNVIMGTQVGKSGYVYVLGGKGAQEGHYIISKGGASNGKNLWQAKDATGRFFIKDMVAHAKATRDGSVAYEYYEWKNKGENESRTKVAAVTYFEPWDWVIGAGLYEDDFEGAVENIQNGISGLVGQMIFVSLLIGGGGILFAFIIAKKIVEPLRTIIEVAEEIAEGVVHCDIDVYQADEVGQLADSFRDMVEALKHKVEIAEDIAAGNYDAEMTLASDRDELGHAIRMLQKNVQQSHAESESLVVYQRTELERIMRNLALLAQGKTNIDTGITDAEGGLSEVRERFVKACDSMKMLSQVIQNIGIETAVLIGAVKDGELQQRANANNFEGAFKDFITGLNLVIETATNPVQEATEILEKFAAGDLTVAVVGNYKGDHGKIKVAVNGAIKSVLDIILDLRLAAESVVHASEELAATAREISKGAEIQASSLVETSSSITEMSATITETRKNVETQSASVTQMATGIDELSHSIEEVAKNAGAVKKLAVESSHSARVGGEAVEKTVVGMNTINDVVGGISTAISGLGKRSEEIGDIVSTINEIAEQTNLLALNAAIEAARAGEHGKGFAVVADEVRKLAERSQMSTKDIGILIKGIQDETASAIKTTEESVHSVEEGISLANEAGGSITEIIKSVDDTNALIVEISNATEQQALGSDQIVQAVTLVTKMTEQVYFATEEQAAGSEQIVKAVDSVNAITQQNSAAAVEMANSTDQLARLAEELQRSINNFKVG